MIFLAKAALGFGVTIAVVGAYVFHEGVIRVDVDENRAGDVLRKAVAAAACLRERIARRYLWVRKICAPTGKADRCPWISRQSEFCPRPGPHQCGRIRGAHDKFLRPFPLEKGRQSHYWPTSPTPSRWRAVWRVPARKCRCVHLDQQQGTSPRTRVWPMSGNAAAQRCALPPL